MSERKVIPHRSFPSSGGAFDSIHNRRERTSARTADTSATQRDSAPDNGLRDSMSSRHKRMEDRTRKEEQANGIQHQRKKLILLPRSVSGTPTSFTDQSTENEQAVADTVDTQLQGATIPTTSPDQLRPSASLRLASTYPELVRHGDQYLPRYYRASQQNSMARYPQMMGNSFWKALAKLHFGDFTRYECLKHFVMQKVIWAYCDDTHPLHDDYMKSAGSFRRETDLELFAALECPDAVGLNYILLDLVARELNIAIRVYGGILATGEPEDLQYTAGSQDSFCYSMLRCPGEGKSRSTWASLEPDRSGKDLVDFLAHTETRLQKLGDHGLQMKQICWYAKDDEQNQIICVNGFRTSPVYPRPQNPLNQLVVFEMVISESKHITEAVDILLAAAKHAPNHHRRILTSGSRTRGVAKPYGSADFEFAKLPRALLEGLNSQEVQALVDTGEVENVPSVFTFAVGGRAVGHFNILHMMEHPDEETVAAMLVLLVEIVFNSELIKWHWNYQQDIPAIACWIAHLWQGTPRESFNHTPYGAAQAHRIEPSFKLKSKFFDGVRPPALTFPTVSYECEVHESGKLSEHGLACPCSTGNLDIAPALTDFCRQQGRGGNLDKLPWYLPRKHVNFDRMLSRLMKDDRRFAILQSLKAVPEGDKLHFYQTIGDIGAALDDQKMGYLTVDVLGPGMVVDELISSDDPHLNTGKLSAWFHASEGQDHTVIKREVPQRISPFTSTSGITLFEDNPRCFKQPEEPVFEEHVWFDTDEDFARPEALQPWEHDRQVNLLRQKVPMHTADGITVQKQYYEPLDGQTLSIIAEQKQHLLRLVTDTRKLKWQAVCANPLPEDSFRMIVRSNMTHSEALVEHILATSVSTPIPGFGAPPGSPLGLPKWLNRVPGWKLPGARPIFDAMAHGQDLKSPSFQKRGIPFVTPVLLYQEQDVHPTELMRAAAFQLPKGSSSETAQEYLMRMKRWMKDRISKEEQANAERGPPSFVDVSDVFDPEGRDFRRRMEAAQEFQKRNMLHVPLVKEGEDWTSIATETLKILGDVGS